MGRPWSIDNVDSKAQTFQKKSSSLYVWWSQKGMLCYELLGPGKTIKAEIYQE